MIIDTEKILYPDQAKCIYEDEEGVTKARQFFMFAALGEIKQIKCQMSCN